MDHRQALNREGVQGPRPARVPMARVEDQLDAFQTCHQLPGRLGRADWAIVETQEFERDHYADRCSALARDFQAIPHPPARRLLAQAGDTGRNGEQMCRADCATDVEPRIEIRLE